MHGMQLCYMKLNMLGYLYYLMLILQAINPATINNNFIDVIY